MILFDFENAKNAKRVLCLGCCFFKGKSLKLDWWSPEVGCFKEGASAKEIWVRMIGLSVHLWRKDFFKRVGDACGGFVAVDTVERYHLQWARILISFNRRRVPRLLNEVAGSSANAIHLWWEAPPWLLSASTKENHWMLEVREDSEERSCAARCVGVEFRKRAKSHMASSEPFAC